jgi:1-acyl-sn-glycerol-3-phosphate acyltransferase
MIYLRSLLYLVGQTLTAVVVSVIAICCFFLPSLTRAKVISIWARFNIWSLRILCGTTYRVTGVENIPDQPSIIISNHQSAWETLAFQLIFPPQSYLLKRNLLWIPFFGWGLAMNRPIAIDRSKKARALDQLIKQGKERLAEGRWLVIFPEGTRMEPGNPGQFQVGGAMIATKSGSPVVPVAHNAGVFWPKNSFLKYPGVIDVIIGPAIEPQRKKAREVNQEVEEWVHERVEKLPNK